MDVRWQAQERSSQPSMRRSASSPDETLKGNLKYDEKLSLIANFEVLYVSSGDKALCRECLMLVLKQSRF